MNFDDCPYALVVNDINNPEFRLEEHKPGAWELKINDFLKPIDPAKYFVTSGEAVRKTEALKDDLLKALSGVFALKEVLEKLKGGSLYLETQHHQGGRLIVIKKDKRVKKDLQ